jgi:hypothetical protein
MNEHLKRMIIINPVLEKRLISANHRLKLKTLLFEISEIMMSRSMLSMKSDLRNREIATVFFLKIGLKLILIN